MIGSDFGFVDLLYKRLNRYKNYLSKSAQKRVALFLEKTVYVFSIAGPILTAPQVGKIYTTQNVAGISLISWIGYLIIALFWLVYSVFMKNKPIMVANVFWVLMDALIIAGILMYS